MYCRLVTVARERGRARFRLLTGGFTLTLAFVLVLTLAHAHSTHAKELSYDFTTLDVPFPGTDQQGLSGINDQGEIVGGYHNIQTGIHSFIYDRGQFTSFDAPFPTSNPRVEGHETHASGINNRGQIVGYIEVFLIHPEGHEFHGFVLDRGVFNQIDFPGAVGGTLATGINDRGEIVGSYLGSDAEGHGFVFDRGMFSSFDIPFPGAHDIGWGLIGINNRGQIVGTYNSVTPGIYTQGFLYDHGIFSHLNTPPSNVTNGTLINGINDVGQIVGCVGGLGAYLFEQGNSIPLHVPFGDAVAQGINNSGQIVGYTSFGGTLHGFVATPRRK